MPKPAPKLLKTAILDAVEEMVRDYYSEPDGDVDADSLERVLYRLHLLLSASGAALPPAWKPVLEPDTKFCDSCGHMIGINQPCACGL